MNDFKHIATYVGIGVVVGLLLNRLSRITFNFLWIFVIVALIAFVIKKRG